VSQDQENSGAPEGKRVRPRGRERIPREKNRRGFFHPDHRGYKPSTGGAITTVDDESSSFLHAAYGAAVAKQERSRLRDSHRGSPQSLQACL
jgi:hypothetical protein